MLPQSRSQAQTAFRNFRTRWKRDYSSIVKQLERDLPELVSFFSLPKHLWRKLRTTNVIERCFVEVRRRTRPMVCFVNVKSVDRIICSISRDLTCNGKIAPSVSRCHSSCLSTVLRSAEG
jgi:putative transposase